MKTITKDFFSRPPKKLILCGPSASGKNFWATQTGLPQIITYTTRPPRPNEVHGKDYFFIDDQAFTDLEDCDLFFESRTYEASQNGKPVTWKYGTILKDLQQPQFVIVLDLQGAEKVKNFTGATVVYLQVDEFTAFVRGKKGRPNFDTLEFFRRLKNDNEQFSQYQHIIDYIYNNEEEH